MALIRLVTVATVAAVALAPLVPHALGRMVAPGARAWLTQSRARHCFTRAVVVVAVRAPAQRAAQVSAVLVVQVVQVLTV